MAGPHDRCMFRFIRKRPFSKVVVPVYILSSNAGGSGSFPPVMLSVISILAIPAVVS